MEPASSNGTSVRKYKPASAAMFWDMIFGSRMTRIYGSGFSIICSMFRILSYVCSCILYSGFLFPTTVLHKYHNSVYYVVYSYCQATNSHPGLRVWLVDSQDLHSGVISLTELGPGADLALLFPNTHR